MRTRHPLSLLVCLVAVLAARTALASCGDVDGDGAFGSSDLDDLLAYLADPVAAPLSPDGLAQCTVTGRARPCDVLDVVVMRRNLDGLGPPLGDGCEDGDQDGVLDPADLCLSTPPGVAPLDTVSGCSPLDVMLDPESLTEPATADLAESAMLLGAPEFATQPLILDLRDAVDLGMAEMALAASDARAGNLCSAASQYVAALTEIALRRDVVQTEYMHLRLDLETDGPGPPDDHPGDGQLAVAALDIALVATDRAMATADVAAEAFDASCAAVAGPLSVSGVVRGVDDQLGVLILEDDSVIALPEGAVPQPIGPGGQVDVVGTQIAASAGVDIGIATNVDCPDCADSNPGNLEPACLHLRLAPVQGFAPFVTEPVTYHLLSSYEGNSPAGNLELEREMRFLVLQGWCEGSSSLFVKPRYSMKITIGSKTVAEDLVPGDGPVRIPSDVVLDQPQILTAVVRRQLCSFPNGCGPFTDYSTPLTWPVEVHERGSLCTAWNLVDQFDLEDNETGYRWQFMTGITKDPTAIQNADNPYFFAQTCDAPSASPGCASGPIVTTPQGYGFKIFNQDFYPVHGRASGFQGFFLSKRHGVTAAVGMRWPSVAGFRNSSVYWYSCQVQPIVRDVVNFCASPAMEDSYYRYPVYPGGPGGGWSVANGNSDQNPGHSGLQSFAWDMVAPLGSRIRATRGGRVTMLKESSTPFTNTVEGSIQSNVCYQKLKTCHLNASLGSCTSSANCSGNLCAYGVCVTQAARTSCQNDYPCDNGNYLYVRHQDGTFATYWHMNQNDVTPVKDQILRRADEVGGVGDTGNSTTEHLHYHVQTTNGIDTSASIRTRFQTALSQAPNNLCQIPGNGNTLPSSNEPLAFY